MAEIILDAERSLEEQLRELLDLATEHGIGHSQVEWYPQAGMEGATLPHGSVVQVPDQLAELWAGGTSKPKTSRARRGKAAKVAEDKTDGTDGAGNGDGGEKTEE